MILKSSRRGNVGLDAIMLVVVLFVIGIASIIGYVVIKDVNDDVQADPSMNNQSKQTLDTMTTQYPSMMDNAFVFILGLMWCLAIIASFFVDTHPIFLILACVILLFVVFVSASIENVYAEFIDEPDLAAAAVSFPKTNWIMDHMVLTILAIAISIAMAMYGKNKYG